MTVITFHQKNTRNFLYYIFSTSNKCKQKLVADYGEKFTGICIQINILRVKTEESFIKKCLNII